MASPDNPAYAEPVCLNLVNGECREPCSPDYCVEHTGPCVYCLADVTVCERIAKNHPNQPIWKIYADQARYDAAQHTSDEHKRPA